MDLCGGECDVISLFLCVDLLVYLFVLCDVACLTGIVNCMVKQFKICLGVVAILLMNVMDVFSVGGGGRAVLDRTCMVSQIMCVLCR